MTQPSLDSDVREFALLWCEGADTAKSLSTAIKIRYGEWEQVANVSVVPSDYLSWSKFSVEEAGASLLRKLAELPSNIDKTAEAVRSFWQSEKDCARANARIRSLQTCCLTAADLSVLNVLERARRWIKSVLGRLPDDLSGRFGPGTSLGLLSGKTTIPDKLSMAPTYYGYLPLIKHCLPLHWELACGGRSAVEVPGNRFTTVPKDAKTDRGIGIEAGANVYVQLGIGSEIRARLKRCGIDLNRNQDLHRLLARQASIDGRKATIDLSRASDTLCRELVKFLLPEEWFELLDAVRAKRTFINDRWVFLEKFSSMGNGFTFELETLVFLSLMVAVSRGRVGKDLFAYGDDLICPVDDAKSVVGILRWVGFTPNPKKTFLDGPFRESCGGDYFRGHAVRALYLKETPNDPIEWIKVANAVARFAEQDNRDPCDHWSYQAWRFAVSRVPSDVRRYRGPSALGDSVIHDKDPRTWFSTRKHSIRYIRGVVPHGKNVPLSYWNSRVQLASALYGVPSQGPVPRNSIRGYRAKWLAFS